ncbi:tetratricopeptide repeat protein [candidate division KSB1 bacterium]|nr:tetratricopeptide repeat protein [candidate division KSB1 bacterium]
MRFFAQGFVLIFLIVTCLSGQSLIQQADSLYELRGENFNEETLLADSTNINKAIDLYKQAIENNTGAEKEEAIWKLMRAYYFKGNYTTHDSELKKAIYDKGKNLGEEGLDEFPKSKGINLFSAIVWGVWGEEFGILKAARKGVAGKIKDRCETVIEIDPMFDEAGAYRVLGRVHFKAPKIPFILGWPSKDKAVEYLQKAHEKYPENLTTKQFLAEALYEKDKKEEAISLMKEILAEEETVEGIAEDAVLKAEVRETLKEWES